MPGAERLAVAVAAGEGLAEAFQRGIAGDDGGLGGGGAGMGQPGELAGVGEGVERGDGFAEAEQARRIQARRLAVAGAVGEERQRRPQQVERAVGARGDGEVVVAGDGLVPGDGSGSRALEGGEGVGIEAGAGDERESDGDAVVPGEDGEGVKEAVEGRGGPDDAEHGTARCLAASLPR